MAIKHISDYENIHSVNTLFRIVGEADLYIEEKNGNQYLIFASTDKNKEVLKKYTELWDEIKYLIKAINSGEAGEYGKEYMKIKFILDDNLSLDKILKFHMLTVIVGSFFQEENKYYPQVFIGECLYEL